MTFILQYILVGNHIAVFVINKEKYIKQDSHANIYAFSLVYQTYPLECRCSNHECLRYWFCHKSGHPAGRLVVQLYP